MSKGDFEWDIFISHASTDKVELVKELANELRTVGLKVWYDEFSLKVGDSLSQSISEGLSKSEFCLVVISKNFFGKKWTEYELRGITSLDVLHNRVVLPIFHEITPEEVALNNPTLSDKVGFLTEGKSIRAIALEIIERVKPDIFQRIQSKAAYYKLRREAEPQIVELSEIKLSPRRREKLTFDLSQRLRSIYNQVGDVCGMPFGQWEDSFLRDMNPVDEIRIWERFANTYSEFCKRFHIFMYPDKESVYEKLFPILMTGNLSTVNGSFTDEEFEFIENSWTSEKPI